ncbi:phosphoribosyltransferase [Streptomyces sp. 3MP-14]|uniref:Phosphoribosyltransferase n=1 Tax=Streptomyces mimosae TaxID=2586635 RepID=A0A5N6AQY5_9ACTN|nr:MULTISPECIES: phosphoribosyltransferase family protein [Streptomyces]KAB8171024.1 phosphoribosyltransferase [Streptomyces mimosae]KAB8179625.1 phosphoribosyltransferase [Streptomyces sp. 3MP-14]
MRFADRREAGRRLARELAPLRGRNVVVLGLPRGGVPVAAEVATALGAPLDVAVVRKLGLPAQPELAMGAIAEDGARVLNDQVVGGARVNEDALDGVEARERAELDRRSLAYRGERPRVSVVDRTVVVVDDGIATGATARAACRSARTRGAARVVLAVPVAPTDWERRIGGEADELVCPEVVDDFLAVGQFYADFAQTTDEEVVELLRRGSARAVEIPAGGVTLPGELTLPAEATGVVLFAHGSGSGRHSPRNTFVAEALAQAGLGTLLFDLLTEGEAADRANVFDIGLLAERLGHATDWVREHGAPHDGLRIGYFGASTGAAAALWAAADPASPVGAVVSRGGRPDLADRRLSEVRCPTLLIVGGNDERVLELNRAAEQSLQGPHELTVIPGATHLFPEPGALSEVTALARDWFLTHLGPRP